MGNIHDGLNSAACVANLIKLGQALLKVSLDLSEVSEESADGSADCVASVFGAGAIVAVDSMAGA
eukprot:15473293-Alexandrium_andersonii.AAC.1